MQSDFIERARHARECLHDMARRPGAVKEYLTAVKALPAEMRSIGLGQALATLLSRSKSQTDGFRSLYDHVEAWLMQRRQIYKTSPPPALLSAVMAGDNAQYRRATAEADAYLAVLKRLAEVFLTNQDKSAKDRPQAAE